jgi:hypothetical protein
MVLLSTQTASNSASISFTSGIDSTYKEYIFKFYNVNPATDGAYFTFQVNASGQTGFNEVITSAYFKVEHGEDNTVQGPAYGTGEDQAQGTAYQYLTAGMGNGSDECGAGVLHLFNPSNTTYAKLFYSTAQYYHLSNYSIESFAAGYINTTSAIDEISFKMSSGNFDGTIKMYGVG